MGISLIVDWVQLDSLLELLGGFLVLSGPIGERPQTHVAFGAGVAQFDCLVTRLLCRGDPALLLGRVIHIPVGFAEAGLCWTVIGIEFERLFENRFGAGQRFGFGSLPDRK